MAQWLMKSEPDAFSIDDLKRAKVEPWDGIRNYQVRNMFRDDFRIGDDVLFYHSSCKVPAVVGTAKVVSDAYPDPTQFDPETKYYDPKSNPENPRWLLVDLRFKRKLKRPIPLTEIKSTNGLDGFQLIKRGNRLSVFPVSKKHWDIVLALE